MLWEICQHGYNTASNLSNVASPPKKVGRQTCFKLISKTVIKCPNLTFGYILFDELNGQNPGGGGGGVAIDRLSV